MVEAKEEGLAPASGLQQAKGYAQQLGLLFVHSANGHGIEEFDFSTGLQRSLDRFPSPDEFYARYSAAGMGARTGHRAGRRDVPGPAGRPLLRG